MPTYMTQFAYTADAWTTLAKNPTDRSTGLKALIEKAGGRFINLYYSFGEYDGVVLFEAPNDRAAASIPLAAVTAGHIKAIKTTPLLTVQEAMEAMRMAGGQSYKPPERG